MSLRI